MHTCWTVGRNRILMLTRVFSIDFLQTVMTGKQASKGAYVRMSGHVYLSRPSPCLSLFRQAFFCLTVYPRSWMLPPSIVAIHKAESKRKGIVSGQCRWVVCPGKHLKNSLPQKRGIKKKKTFFDISHFIPLPSRPKREEERPRRRQTTRRRVDR